MLCLKKRRTYSFTQGACAEAPRRRGNANGPASRRDERQRYIEALVSTLPRKLT